MKGDVPDLHDFLQNLELVGINLVGHEKEELLFYLEVSARNLTTLTTTHSIQQKCTRVRHTTPYMLVSLCIFLYSYCTTMYLKIYITVLYSSKFIKFILVYRVDRLLIDK